MAIVWVMQSALHEVIHMVAVRDYRMSTTGSVDVFRGMSGRTLCAAVGVFSVDLNHVLVHM
jgi:hypothetical protein